jgi:formylglycine-generating enzyme required for sulfatase activity
MGEKTFDTMGDNFPADYVSWYDANAFIKKLNALTGKRFRLPTEAEWEYAARGGRLSKGYRYSGSDNIDEVAWYNLSKGNSHFVGQKVPNELGIYDMSGNIWEWCSDFWGDYSSKAQINPTGPSTGNYRVLRGGAWARGESDCCASGRASNTEGIRLPICGFRLVHPAK